MACKLTELHISIVRYKDHERPDPSCSSGEKGKGKIPMEKTDEYDQL